MSIQPSALIRVLRTARSTTWASTAQALLRRAASKDLILQSRRSSVSVRLQLQRSRKRITLFVIDRNGKFYTAWLSHWPSAYGAFSSQYEKGLRRLFPSKNVITYQASRRNIVTLGDVRERLDHVWPLVERTVEAIRRVDDWTAGQWPRPDPRTEKAAVRHVTRWLRRQGYTVISRERDSLGYDLEATRRGGRLHVEVKGSLTATERFFLSRNERTTARRDPAWRLAMVVSATGHPTLRLYSHAQMMRRFALVPTHWEARMTEART